MSWKPQGPKFSATSLVAYVHWLDHGIRNGPGEKAAKNSHYYSEYVWALVWIRMRPNNINQFL